MNDKKAVIILKAYRTTGLIGLTKKNNYEYM